MEVKNEHPNIDDLKLNIDKLHLEEDDILIIRTNRNLAFEEYKDLKRTLQSYNLNNPIIYLEDDINLNKSKINEIKNYLNQLEEKLDNE